MVVVLGCRVNAEPSGSSATEVPAGPVAAVGTGNSALACWRGAGRGGIERASVVPAVRCVIRRGSLHLDRIPGGWQMGMFVYKRMGSVGANARRERVGVGRR